MFETKVTWSPEVVARLKEANANPLSRDSLRTEGVFAGIGGQRDGPDGGNMVLKEREGRGERGTRVDIFMARLTEAAIIALSIGYDT